MGQPSEKRKRDTYFRNRRLRSKEKGFLKIRIVRDKNYLFPRELQTASYYRCKR